MELVDFRVRYEALTRGEHRVTVEVVDGVEGIVTGPDLADVFRMAGAVMRAVVDPDPIEVAFALPSAPDGPKEGGR